MRSSTSLVQSNAHGVRRLDLATELLVVLMTSDYADLKVATRPFNPDTMLSAHCRTSGDDGGLQPRPHAMAAGLMTCRAGTDADGSPLRNGRHVTLARPDLPSGTDHYTAARITTIRYIAGPQ